LHLNSFNAIAVTKAPSMNPGLNSIYGVDDRELVTSNSLEIIKSLSKSVGIIVSVDNLDIGLFTTKILASSLQENVNMCLNEKFITRPSLSACTAFLVAEDIIVTAGHCFQDYSDCKTKKIIFEMTAQKQSSKGYTILSKNVFSCKEIIRSQFGGDSDFAIIRLDKKPNRPFLKLNRTHEKISDNASVFMLGHPMGLPLMLSKSSKIVDNTSNEIFKTSLDSFVGNSGSPVFNTKTFEVEGLLVSGQEDLVYDSERECYRNQVYNEGGNEGVSRISELLTFLN
jgi:V8-like Glu-specific endopeptidase